jgi:hypothetical protein
MGTLNGLRRLAINEREKKTGIYDDTRSKAMGAYLGSEQYGKCFFSNCLVHRHYMIASTVKG